MKSYVHTHTQTYTSKHILNIHTHMYILKYIFDRELRKKNVIAVMHFEVVHIKRVCCVREKPK